MEKDTLLIITRAFPVENTEPFLENEIAVLCRLFRRIFLVPLSGKTQILFTLPENVHCLMPGPFHRGTFRYVFLKHLFFITRVIWMDLAGAPGKWKKLRRIKDLLLQLCAAITVGKALEEKWRQAGIDPRRTCFYSFWMYTGALALAVLKMRHRIESFSSRTHGFDLFEERSQYGFIPFQNVNIRLAAWVFPDSAAGAKHLVARGYPQKKIVVSHFGAFDHGSNPHDKNVLRIVSCSNMVAVKRIHLIIEILRRVTVEAEWIHFGDGPLRKELLVSAEELPPHIHWTFRGHVFNREIIAWYRQTPVSFFLSTTSSEGGPLSMIEALSFGIPVVAPDVGGVSDMVTPETGLLLSEQVDCAAVAEWVSAFPGSHLNTERFRAGVKEYFKEHFLAERIYTRFAEELRR